MPRRVAIAIHLSLAFMLAMPLSYYLGRDARDERYAWRMFSPTRLERCGTEFYLGDSKSPLRLGKYFHPAWIGMANRGRKVVVEAMAAHLCEKFSENPRIRVRMQCELRPGAVAQSRELYSKKRAKSDALVEVVSQGGFNLCKTKYL